MRVAAMALVGLIAVVACGGRPQPSAAHPSAAASTCFSAALPSPSPTPPDETDYHLVIRPGDAPSRRDVTVSDTVFQFTVQTAWDVGRVSTSLVAPSGKTYDATTTYASASHRATPDFESWSFRHPETGDWTIVVTGSSVPPSGIKLGMGVFEITFSEFPPYPSFIPSPDRGVAPLTVRFAGESTASNGATITATRWDFGDCSAIVTGTMMPSHEYRVAGTYSASLTATDSNGVSGTTTYEITVTAYDHPPTAVFAFANLDPARSRLATFYAGDSNDVDGRIVTYAWDFGDGTTGAGPSLNHDYAKPGSYPVKLTVTDDAGLTASTCHVVTVDQGSATASCPA